ncbi:MAG TPA: acyl-CoA dehydrogenase family protein [Thermoplasmata archaeon]|nr:acyl-CoA dehydrogenase family protein [Thermoplasmata archaeon]
MSEVPGAENDPLLAEVRRAVEALGLAQVYRQLDARPRFPWEEFRSLGAHGLLGLTLPPEFGGRGISTLRAAEALHALAAAAGTTFAKLAIQPEFSSVLAREGAPELRAAYFLPMMRGKRLIANHVTEPAAGSDLRAIATTAERTGPVYVVNGTKSQAAFAVDAQAAIVYVRVKGSAASGLTALLVPQDLIGIQRRVVDDLGERWMRRGTVTYSSVEVPVDHRLGDEGRALEYLKEELVHERVLLAAIYLGVAGASWEETSAHVGRRAVFGKRLADQEAVAFPLAEDRARLDAAWLYIREVAAQADAGTVSAGRAALAKWLAVDVALRTLDHAIQFHGGQGYSKELPHEQRWRDVRSGALAHGPSEVMLWIAARELWPTAPPAGAPTG